MQVNGFGDAVRELMTTETKKRKILLAAINSCILVSSIMFAGFWFAATSNASKYNDYAAKYVGDSVNWYDT